MKRLLLCVLVISLTVLSGEAFTAVVQDQEDVRGAFMTTRPKATSPSANRTSKAVRKRPRPNPTQTSSGTPAVKTTKPEPTPTPKIREQKIGLGVTLFMRDANGLSVRVDPTRDFRRDERVRLLLETNTDGYLYVFNTTDGGQSVMIYPDPELDEGGNYIQAHVPVEVPSSLASEERLRWFRFDAQPGMERLYFVFTREPLAGIPLEDELINFCREKETNCPIRPAADLWSQLQAESNSPMQVHKTSEFGATQTSTEAEATTRGIGLNKEDPEPAVVMMSSTSNKTTLVAVLELVHK